MAKKPKKKKRDRGGNRLLKFEANQLEFMWNATRTFKPAGAGLEVLTHGLALIDELEKHRKPKKIGDLKAINAELADMKDAGRGMARKEEWLDEEGVSESYFPKQGASITIENRWHEAIVAIFMAIRPNLNMAGMKNAIDIADKVEIREEFEAAIDEAEEEAQKAKDKKK